MEIVKGKYVQCIDVYQRWLNEILNSGLDIYWLKNGTNINKEKHGSNKSGCALICKCIYFSNVNCLVMDFIEKMKPTFIMIIGEIDGDGAISELTNMIDEIDDYVIIRRMVECRYDFEFITSVFSTDKSIEFQNCVEFERGVGVEWYYD